MSIFNCHKQEPQPWMSYVSRNKITYPGGCCPALVMPVDSLLPFQIISEGDYIRSEISVYGSDVWTEITIPITTVISEGFYIHSYDGTALGTPLDCGAYEFRVVAGETWWFEPFTIEDFTFTENSFRIRDLLMAPLKFSEQRFDTLPLIAPCDSFLPFMFTTENPTSGSPTYTLIASDGTETALTITVDVLTIAGRTYYIHDGACFYPFLTCGQYHIRINDGVFVYYSVPFNVECGMNDIADGYRAMRDANGCVMRDEDGDILIEECFETPAPFMITIDTTKAGSAADTFILPITAISGDYTVDWGDGTEETFTTIGNKSHTYSAQGEYQVSVSGGMTALSFYSLSDRLKVIYIDQWGDIAWSSMYRAFYGCQNMTGRYTDTPNTSLVVDFRYMFFLCSVFNQAVNFDTSSANTLSLMFGNCTVFNQSVASFDTSNVVNFSYMFNACLAFNQSVSNFDTSLAENISYMFYGCHVFNQSVANFNTSLVTDFRSMFFQCYDFNQSVANFDTSAALTMDSMFSQCHSFNQSVANFDTSLVTSLRTMFYDCTVFNQSVVNFITASVSEFYRMFYNCPAFKQSLATFSLASATNVQDMLSGCDINDVGTSTNYDNTLIAWAAADVPNGLNFHGGTSKYSDAGLAARQSLQTDDSWTITDGGHI